MATNNSAGTGAGGTAATADTTFGGNTVAVLGATGFVGRYLVRELLRRGYTVRALGRSREKARQVLPRDTRLTFLQGDVFSQKDLAELLRGGEEKAGALINLLGIIRETGGGQTFQRVHVDAVREAIAACREAGVGRFLHMSSLAASPEGKGGYQKTKWEGEQLVRRSGLDWTIFRPSIIHGPDGEFVQMVKGMCSGQEPPYYFLPYFSRRRLDMSVPFGRVVWESPRVQPVAVEDVAAAMAESLRRPEAIGEIYPLGGPDVLDWPEMLTYLRDTIPGCNRKMPPWHIPGTHAAAIARVAKALGLGSLLPFDAGTALMAMEDSVADLTKARTHLGFSPRPFRPTVAAYAARA
jgi:uncharacterized protein YbjT (DUF2867 family)